MASAFSKRSTSVIGVVAGAIVDLRQLDLRVQDVRAADAKPGDAAMPRSRSPGSFQSDCAERPVHLALERLAADRVEACASESACSCSLDLQAVGSRACTNTPESWPAIVRKS